MPYKLLIKIFGPIALLAIVVMVYNSKINAAETRGFESRQVEVLELNEKIHLLQDQKLKISNELVTVKKNSDVFSNEVKSLNSKLAAQADEAKLALKVQAKAFASAQKSTNDAMNSLAKNVKSNDVNFIDILEQLKGVSYEYNKENNECIVVGGGRVLRNSARGKAR